jgi:hypothetical protein
MAGGGILTGIRLWSQICDHLYFELRDYLITFPIIVPSQRLIARNVRELFSFNRGVSHLTGRQLLALMSAKFLTSFFGD